MWWEKKNLCFSSVFVTSCCTLLAVQFFSIGSQKLTVEKKKKALPVLCYLMHLTISMKLFSIVLLFCSVSTNPCQAHCMAFTSILLNDNVEVPNDENYRVGFIL